MFQRPRCVRGPDFGPQADRSNPHRRLRRPCARRSCWSGLRGARTQTGGTSCTVEFTGVAKYKTIAGVSTARSNSAVKAQPICFAMPYARHRFYATLSCSRNMSGTCTETLTARTQHAPFDPLNLIPLLEPTLTRTHHETVSRLYIRHVLPLLFLAPPKPDNDTSSVPKRTRSPLDPALQQHPFFSSKA